MSARRTTTRMSSRSSDAASSPATSSRNRRSRVDGARRTAYLTVERMRHPHLHPASDGLERDEATSVGLLDRGRISDPPQGRQFDRLPDSQRVDNIAN